MLHARILRWLLAVLFLLMSVSAANAASTLQVNSSFSLSDLNLYDVTGITYDSVDNSLWLSDSGTADVVVEMPLTGGSITRTLATHVPRAVEGIVHPTFADYLYVMDNQLDLIYKLDRNGNLIGTINPMRDGVGGGAGITVNTTNNQRIITCYSSGYIAYLDANNTFLTVVNAGQKLEGAAYDSTNNKLLSIDNYWKRLWTSNTNFTSGSAVVLTSLGITSPTGVAWRASDSHIFITDMASTPKVFELDAARSVVNSFTLQSANKHPTDVAIDPATGRLYVCDNGPNDTIFVYETNGTFVGPHNLGPGYTEGICFNQNGNLLILDFQARLAEMTTSWSVVSDQTIVVSTTPTDASDIASDASNFYVADYVKKKVIPVLTDGRVAAGFSTAAFGSNLPEGLYFITSSLHFYIVDSASDRMYETTKAGALVASYDLSALGINNVSSITMKTTTGEIFVTDIVNDRVYNLSLVPTGEMGAPPAGMTSGFDAGPLPGFNTEGAGAVAVVDDGGNGVLLITGGMTPGDMFPPEGTPPLGAMSALLDGTGPVPAGDVPDYVPDRSVRVLRYMTIPADDTVLSFDFMLGEFDDTDYFSVSYEGVELARFDSRDKTDGFQTVTLDLGPYTHTSGTLEFYLAGIENDDTVDFLYLDNMHVPGVPEPSSVALILAGALACLGAALVRLRR
jgi:hypothetical protein